MYNLNIAFFLKNLPYSNVDMSSPFEGNPGMGGREYMNLLISSSIYNKSDINVHLYAQDISSLPSYSTVTKVENIHHAIDIMSNNNIELFISDVGLNYDYMNSIVNSCELNNIKLILRMGLMPSSKILKLLSKSNAVLRIICVGHESAEQLVDHPIYNKVSVLRNGISIKPLNFKPPNNKPLDLVYIGSLVEQKGFKRLARVWNDLSKHSPNTKLHVIGSGNLYDRSLKMGELGIADHGFENNIIKKYLFDLNGNIHPNVIFHGAIGINKYDIIKKCSIGIANPTGATETFCISAVELQACGLPVVAGANVGLYDTVLNNQTGILVNSDNQFKKAIIHLLDNGDIRNSMSIKAKSYALNHYDFSKITYEWISLIKILLSNITPPKQSIKSQKNSIFSKFQTIRYYILGGANFATSSYSIRYFFMRIYMKLRVKLF